MGVHEEDEFNTETFKERVIMTVFKEIRAQIETNIKEFVIERLKKGKNPLK